MNDLARQTLASSECTPHFKPWVAVAFFATIAVHLLVVYLKATAAQSAWADLSESRSTWFTGYLQQQEYFLSFSYGLAAGFAAYALSSWSANRRIAAVGGATGISIAGIIYGAGCFLTGCCGSPMLAVYASLFGSKAVGFGKPLTAVITFLSVLLGYFLMRRKACRSGCDL